MYVATVPNRNSPPAILLRESFRLGGKVRNRTLSNLSHWPPAQLDALRSVLKGATSIGAPLPQAFDLVRSRPHGHVAAVLGTLRVAVDVGDGAIGTHRKVAGHQLDADHGAGLEIGGVAPGRPDLSPPGHALGGGSG